LVVFACLLALGALSGCATRSGKTGRTAASEVPPVDILESNFAQAPYVLEIEVKKVRKTATFRSDSGEVGYVQYSVSGTISEILKTTESREFFGNDVEYRFTREYDPSRSPSIRKGDRYLVFLMLPGSSSYFWLIGESAQFELNPQLSETMKRIAQKR